MVLIDTSAWIEYFRFGNKDVVREVDRCLEEERVVMGDLVFCEVLQGIKSARHRKEVKRLFDTLPGYEMVGFDIARKAADNFRMLRSRGITVRKTIDVIIGTFCVENKFTLVHNDRDFDFMAPHIGLATS